MESCIYHCNGDGEPVSYRWHVSKPPIKFLFAFESDVKQMTHTLLPIAYAGPISHWIPIYKEQAIVWEVEDNYQETNLSESHGNPR